MGKTIESRGDTKLPFCLILVRDLVSALLHLEFCTGTSLVYDTHPGFEPFDSKLPKVFLYF